MTKSPSHPASAAPCRPCHPVPSHALEFFTQRYSVFPQAAAETNARARRTLAPSSDSLGALGIGNEMLELSRKVCSNHLLRRKQRRAGADLPVDLRSDDPSGRDRSTGGSGKGTVATLP